MFFPLGMHTLDPLQIHVSRRCTREVPRPSPLRQTQVFVDRLLLQGILEAFPCLHLMLAASVATMRGHDSGVEGAKLGEDSHGRSITTLGTGTSVGGREGGGAAWTRCPGVTGGAGPATAAFWSWWSSAQVEPWMVEVRKWRREAKGQGEKKEGTKGCFYFFFLYVKGNLMFSRARNEPVGGEAAKEAWQTAPR